MQHSTWCNIMGGLHTCLISRCWMCLRVLWEICQIWVQNTQLCAFDALSIVNYYSTCIIMVPGSVVISWTENHAVKSTPPPRLVKITPGSIVQCFVRDGTPLFPFNIYFLLCQVAGCSIHLNLAEFMTSKSISMTY